MLLSQSKQCQRAHWRVHKPHCHDLSEAQAAEFAKAESPFWDQFSQLDIPPAEIYEELMSYAKHYKEELSDLYFIQILLSDPGKLRPDPRTWQNHYLLVVLERHPVPPANARPWARFTRELVQWTPIDPLSEVLLRKHIDRIQAMNEMSGKAGWAVNLTILTCKNAGRGMSFVIANQLDPASLKW